MAVGEQGVNGWQIDLQLVKEARRVVGAGLSISPGKLNVVS